MAVVHSLLQRGWIPRSTRPGRPLSQAVPPLPFLVPTQRRARFPVSLALSLHHLCLPARCFPRSTRKADGPRSPMASSASAPVAEPPLQPPSSSESSPPQALLPFLIQSLSGRAEDGLELALLCAQVAGAVKRIAAAAARLGIEGGLTGAAGGGGQRNQSGDEQKALDVVADEFMMQALRDSLVVAVAASEESPDALLFPIPPSSSPPPPRQQPRFCVVFDPLDGSRNIDAGIPTGTIFGIYPSPTATPSDALQSGSALLASGYALYSSATMLVLSLGQGVHGFTLDPLLGDFVLTHPSMQMPPRGQVYSVNDARYFDWPQGLRRYIDDVRQGKGQTKNKYSARYICSLVADFHRTLMYGGTAMNPRSHLRLVYEANPLSFLAEQAGGKGWDGRERILGLKPQTLHQRLPLFLGSREDIDEMASYGDVRQEVNPGYEV